MGGDRPRDSHEGPGRGGWRCLRPEPRAQPSGPVDYIFACMEPSLGGAWAADPSKARAAMEAGFRNFVNSIEDFLLHFSIRRYLCKPNERYHITDWSKGAMTTRAASVDRGQRYTKWVWTPFGRA
jgi:hypothetical protein